MPSINSPTGEGKIQGIIQVDITVEDGSVYSTRIEKVFDQTVFEVVKVGLNISKVRITTVRMDSWVGWSRVLFKLE